MGARTEETGWDELGWHCASFDELHAGELYAILALRQTVFVVEQGCAFLDADGADLQAWHLWATGPSGDLLAYARLFEPGAVTEEASVGRVVTDPAARGRGLGRALLQRAIAEADQRFGGGPIRVAAQAHRVRFYRSLDFEPVGAPYDEDGISHQDLVRPAVLPPSTEQAPDT